MNQLGQNVEIIVNETTYIKLKMNETHTQSAYGNLELHINDLLSESYFPRYNY